MSKWQNSGKMNNSRKIAKVSWQKSGLTCLKEYDKWEKGGLEKR